jgi:hypothetical protein
MPSFLDFIHDTSEILNPMFPSSLVILQKGKSEDESYALLIE